MLELYITGVEKNINKIYVTAGLAGTMQSLGYSTSVYKPVETGVPEGNFQSKELSVVKYIDPFIKTHFSYQLKEDLTPILSAAAEGLVMEKSVILNDYQKIQGRYECLIVDGVSTLGTPLSKDFLEEDVITMINIPLLFIVSAQNPDINNVLLSVKRIKELGIELRGIVITDFPKETNNMNVKLMPKLIEEYSGYKVLGILSEIKKSINPEDLITEILNNLDLENIFKIKIAKLNN